MKMTDTQIHDMLLNMASRLRKVEAETPEGRTATRMTHNAVANIAHAMLVAMTRKEPTNGD